MEPDLVPALGHFSAALDTVECEGCLARMTLALGPEISSQDALSLAQKFAARLDAAHEMFVRGRASAASCS